MRVYWQSAGYWLPKNYNPIAGTK